VVCGAWGKCPTPEALTAQKPRKPRQSIVYLSSLGQGARCNNAMRNVGMGIPLGRVDVLGYNRCPLSHMTRLQRIVVV
jgi:hypothetical protein